MRDDSTLRPSLFGVDLPRGVRADIDDALEAVLDFGAERRFGLDVLRLLVRDAAPLERLRTDVRLLPREEGAEGTAARPRALGGGARLLSRRLAALDAYEPEPVPVFTPAAAAAPLPLM